MKEKKDLLFFFGDERCPLAAAAIPTLAALAERKGIDFESYICTRPLSWGGKMLPFTGHMHGEGFCYLANFYRRILFVSLTDFASFQFRREILAWGGDIVSCRRGAEIAEFYAEVFAYFHEPVPETAGIVPDPPAETSRIVEGEYYLTPYFYFDLYRGNCLGVTRSAFAAAADKLVKLGVRSAVTFCCDVADPPVPVTAAYSSGPDMDYAGVTRMIAERHWREASGLAFADGSTVLRWMTLFLREKRIPMFQPFDFQKFVPEVAEYAQKIGNPLILGCQNIYPHNTDQVMCEFSKHGMLFDLLGVDPRHGFSLQKKHPLPVDWLADAPAPWEESVSDDFLREKIAAKALPVCFLFYAADLGHLPVLPRILDLMGQEGNRAGLAFPATWYDYAPELLEELYIPLDQGGVFPQLEPMLSSGGTVVTCEAEGVIAPEKLTGLLTEARKKIAGHVGERMVPPGYYPWQDASPFYQTNAAMPQFDAVAQAGFRHYISYRDCQQPGKVLYERNGMTAINQQTRHWFPGDGEASEVLRAFEKGTPFATDWLIMPFDAPFFGLTPVYLNGEALHPRFDGRVMGMQTIAKAMKLARRGGETGRLFMLKPHELFRYIRLLRETRGEK